MFFDVPKTCNEKGKKEKASTGNFGIVFRNYLNHLRHLAFVYVYCFTIGKKKCSAIILMHAEKYVFRLVVSDVFGSMWLSLSFHGLGIRGIFGQERIFSDYAHSRQMCEWSQPEPKMNCVIAIYVIHVVCLSI